MPTALLELVAPPPLQSLPLKKGTRCKIQELLSKAWRPPDGYKMIEGEPIDQK